jgi:hypothetical protein
MIHVVSPDLLFFNVNDKPFGKPFSYWVKEWWKWILEIPASINPAYGYTFYHEQERPYVANPTNQPHDADDVWFLAGAFNDGSIPNAVKRAYRVLNDFPTDKAILVPVINFYAVCRKKEAIPEMEATVKRNIDDINPEILEMRFNDTKVENVTDYRCDTGEGVFEITVNGKDNVVRLKHVLGRPIKLMTKGDGFWLFIKPNVLQSGGKTNEIHSYGSCLQGKIQVKIDHLIIGK